MDTSRPGPDDPGELQRLEDERARLAAEVGELRARLDQAGPRRAGRLRRVATVVLVVLTSLMVTVAVAGVWARRNALNTDRWVETVGPLGSDPAVQEALGRYLTTQVMTAVDAEAFFEEVLPERGQILAVPLANALRGFVADRVDGFLASDEFAGLWEGANRQAHAAAVAVLEGDEGRLQEAGAVEVQDGEVVMNLVPVVNALLERIGQASPEILGRTVDIPTVSVDDLPEEAIARIERALGRELPDDFGQFTVFDATTLTQVQDTVDLVDRLVVAVVVLAAVLLAVTLWVAPRRRRTLLQLLLGIMLGVVLVRRVGLRAEAEVLELVRMPENRDAAAAVVGAFVSSLLDATALVLAVLAIVAGAAVVTGDYPWIVSGRRRAASLARAAGGLATGAAGRTSDPAVTAWVAGQRDLLQAGGVVVGVLVLLVADLSWWGIVALAVVVAAFEVVVGRLAESHATA